MPTLFDRVPSALVKYTSARPVMRRCQVKRPRASTRRVPPSTYALLPATRTCATTREPASPVLVPTT